MFRMVTLCSAEQARLLLAHSPLVGCGTWQQVADDLAGDGYAVTVPDLAGTVAAGPPSASRSVTGARVTRRS
jgi:predicted alpha/beta hydrolase